jgi:Protein of unknown function (DUF1592)/Protein of unknown function (DUF1595)/Protein of unknown function (DUF1588)/Protein of unknown function (DUF1585)/Protein of unknown function (DUF1587)
VCLTASLCLLQSVFEFLPIAPHAGTAWTIMRRAKWCLAASALAFGCSGEVAMSDGELGGNTVGAPTGSAGPVIAPTGSSTTTGSLPTLEPGAPPPPPNFNLNGMPLYSRAIPLTNAQWARSVQDVLKLPEAPTQANSFLAPVGGFTTFLNNERVLEVSNDLRESYQLAAKEVADSVGTDANIARIAAGQDATAFIATLGRRAYRRPLTTEETARYQAIYDVGTELAAGTGTAFTKGAKLVVEAMIQSPNFLYRTELGTAGQPLTGYEVAAKLSLWLLGTTPSDALLDQAKSGMLDTPDGISSVAASMIGNAAATATMTEMHSQLLKLSRMLNVVKFTEDYKPATNNELMEASLLFFDRVYESGLGLKEVLTGTQGYMGPEMAKLYGLPAPSGNAMKLQDFGPSRPGFFSQVPNLVVNGDDIHSDAIHRGVPILQDILCANLKPPEFAVPPTPAPVPGQNDRERIEHHSGKGTCGESCHSNYINPLGYAFESFDGLGRERTTDQGRPIDAVASYPFVDGMKTFDGPVELMEVVANSAEAHKCYARNILSFGLQRDITSADQAEIDALAAISQSGVGSIKDMVKEFVKNPVFRVRSSGGAL